MLLRACKRCQIVRHDVSLYYHELDWQGPPEYLCTDCQKNAFHFHVKMLIVGSIGNRVEDSDEKREKDATDLLQRILAFAKKNNITEDYVGKLLAKETAALRASFEKESPEPPPEETPSP